MRPNKPWTFIEITNYLHNKNANYKLLSKSYQTQHDKLKWECLTCKTLFNRSWKAMQQTVKGEIQGGCPTCNKRVTYTIADVKAKLKADKRPIISLESTYSNNKAPMKWQCTAKKCGHIWTNNWKAVNGVAGFTPQGCQKCYENNPQYSIAELKAKLVDQNINAELLTKTYKNLKSTKLKFKCLNTECGHIWDAMWSNVTNAENGCPVCSSLGITEKGIKQFLDKVFGAGIFTKVKPDFLINPKTGFPLEIDCYSKKLNLAIEIQGGQHYKYCKFFHRNKQDFQKQLDKDCFKKTKIEEKGIRFIELDISSILKIKNIKQTLKEKLIYIGIKIPKSYDKFDIQRYHKDDKLRKRNIKKPYTRTNWTVSLVKKHFKNTTFSPILNKYENNQQNIKWKCNVCSYEFLKPLYKMIDKVKKGLSCKECTKVKMGYDINKLKESVKNKKLNVECLSEEYINSVTPLKWRCLNQHCCSVFYNIWGSVQRSSSGGCIFCTLNHDRNLFLLNALKTIFGDNNVEVLILDVFDDLKQTKYQVYTVPSKKLVIELDNWYDKEFFKRYHGSEEAFNRQQKSNLKKDKTLKEQGFIQIKIPLKKDIHFIDIERKLTKSLTQMNLI